MYSRILVPLDGSDLSEQVLPYVIPLARQFGAPVHLLHAVTSLTEMMARSAPTGLEGAVPATGVELAEEAYQAEVESGRNYLSSVASRVQTEGLTVQWQVMEGHAADVVTGYARDHDIDLIAMSTHGRSGLGRLVFGSVAEAVVRDCRIPVLLVHPAEKSA